MNNQTIQILTPILNIVIVAALGYLGKEVVKVVPKIIELMVAKIGLTNAIKTKDIGMDVFNKLEEDGRLGKLVNSKIVEFTNLMKAKVPGITDEEIDFLRQAIAGEFNKDKAAVIKEVEQQVQEIQVTPVTKYYAPDGTELQPVVVNSKSEPDTISENEQPTDIVQV